MKGEIKKIVLDLGGKKEISLDLEQAKKLHELLDNLFGTKTETIHIPYYPIVYRERIAYWDYPTPVW